MRSVLRFLGALYFRPQFFYAFWVMWFCLVLGYFVEPLFLVGQIILAAIIFLSLVEVILLFAAKQSIRVRRATTDKWSNGDENEVRLYVENFYLFPVRCKIIDEIPHQFQRRDVDFRAKIPSRELRRLDYSLRPVERGLYQYGVINVYATSPIGMVYRRFRITQQKDIAVYPSFIQMRKYELLAVSNKLTMAGIKKIRKVAKSLEFDQIREYVAGDDYRTINWKATARKTKLMVNQYQDEKSQNVYSLIDMGRVMRSPFNGLTLLDYAINASLIISNIAMLKEDKAGIITFSNKIQQVLKSGRRGIQMQKIMELLYAARTDFQETDFEALYIAAKQHIRQRSLLLLYTNFESVAALQRQLPYFSKLAKSHLVVVVFFVNTELDELLETPPRNPEGIYIKTIAEKYAFEKRLIAKELERHGIHSILTPPAALNVEVINKYLELKSRGLL